MFSSLCNPGWQYFCWIIFLIFCAIHRDLRHHTRRSSKDLSWITSSLFPTSAEMVAGIHELHALAKVYPAIPLVFSPVNSLIFCYLHWLRIFQIKYWFLFAQQFLLQYLSFLLHFIISSKCTFHTLLENLLC